MQLQPIGLIGATLFIQLCLLLLLFATNRMLPERGFVHLRSRCDRATLVLAIVTVACMVASDEMYRAWAPILGDLAFGSGIGRSTTYLLLFSVDLSVAFWLMTLTGGSKNSPYTAILFMLPSLAIFLREPAGRFVFYAALAAIFYGLGLLAESRRLTPMDILRGDSYMGPKYSSIRTDTPAHATINLGCLFIATVTGFITRPIPL